MFDFVKLKRRSTQGDDAPLGVEAFQITCGAFRRQPPQFSRFLFRRAALAAAFMQCHSESSRMPYGQRQMIVVVIQDGHMPRRGREEGRERTGQATSFRN